MEVEPETFTLFQKELHRRTGEGVPEKIKTVFIHRFVKISWYAPIKEQLEAVSSNQGITYTVSNSHDYLLKTFLVSYLPAIRVKPEYINEYRIAWTHNPGINIVQNAVLKANNTQLNSFDSITHDILSQYGYIVKRGFKSFHRQKIGNIPKLEEWTTFLPYHPIDVPQPFFYATDNHRGLPLLKSSLIKYTHNYTFRRKILDLLRMQKYDSVTESWVNIVPEAKFLEGIKDDDQEIPQPQLWGRYSQITKAEREWYKSCPMTHEIFYDDVVTCNAINSISYGQTLNIPLTAQTPVKAVFWVSQNLTAVANHNYSNYTTNADDVTQGYNPNISFSFKHGNIQRIPETDIGKAEEDTWEFPRAPWENGYNVITFCNDPFSFDGQASISLAESNKVGNITIKLGNNDPNFIRPGNSEPKKETEPTTDIQNSVLSPQFFINCRLLVYRKFSFFHEKDKGFDFTIDKLDNTRIYYDDKKKTK